MSLALLSLHSFLRWRDAGSHGLPWAAALWLIPALLAPLAHDLTLNGVMLCSAALAFLRLISSVLR